MLTDLMDMKKKMNTKPILKNIDIEDLQENKLNKFSMDGIDELIENINQYGLQKPLEVYYEEEIQKYILIGGHRRLIALRKLFDLDLIEADIPCLVYSRPHNELTNVEERMRIILSNAQRDMSEKDKLEITKELLDILKTDPTQKPNGTNTREWIAPFLGCKSRTAQKYINLALGKKEGKKKSQTKTDIGITDFYKLLERTNAKLQEVYWSMSDEARKEIISKAKDQDINIDMMITKLMNITSLYMTAIDSKRSE